MGFNVKVPKATHSRSTFKMRMPHLQSAEFMENNVVMCKYTVPTDVFTINPVLEARCAALSNPSFISTEYHVRSFYVPHSVVWERFDDWINGNPTFINGTSVSNDVPTFSDKFITEFFQGSGSHTPGAGDVYSIADWKAHDHNFGTDGSVYDFAVETSDSSITGYYFNGQGRYWYKLLLSLGYKFNFTVKGAAASDMNALALLSYFKVWVDYFVPPLRKQLSNVNKVLSIFYNSALASNRFEDVFAGTDMALFEAAMQELTHPYYPSSYLTSAWQTPIQPLSSPASTINSTAAYKSNFNPIINYNATSSDNATIYQQWSDGTFGVSSNSSLSPWVMNNATKIANWLMRSRFVGSEKLLNILSRFGVKPDSPLAHTARYCGGFTQPLVVQDINAMASSSENVLGDYAGKMFTQPSNQRTFHIKADDYGCIIVTSMITPANITYYQGIDREILKTKPLQFYQPEFDSVGCEEVSMRELMSGFTYPGWETTLNGEVGAGFVPRMSSYKVSNGTVSGDFAVKTLNTGFDSYHDFRALYKYGRFTGSGGTDMNAVVPDTGNKMDINSVAYSQSSDSVKAQTALLQTAYDRNQFNRIFNVQNDAQDHIFTMYYLNIDANRPMRSIADSMPMLEDSTASGEKVDVQSDVIENYK